MKVRSVRWLRDLIRRDGLALVLFALATVAMTWPLALHLGDSVVLGDRDVWSAIWQNWWLREVVTHGYKPTFSPYLFHPTGLDVTYQPRRWTSLGTWLPLASLFGDLAAFNLAAMLGIFLSAYATYALIVYLVGDWLAACFGGALFAFYPQHLWGALEQPNTGSIQWIPVFMLALIHALRTRKPLHLGLAALALALNWWLNLKIGVLAGLTGGLYVLYMLLVEGWWREATFWKAMALFGMLSATLIAPVLYPTVANGENLQAAVALYEPEEGADLLGYIVPSPWSNRPELPPPLRWVSGMEPTNFRYRPFYLGLTAVWLAIIGATGVYRRGSDRRGVWLMMALVFFALSLGTVLVVAQEPKPEVWLPYRLVAGNMLFRALRNPHRFSLVLILAISVLAAYGLSRASVRRVALSLAWSGALPALALQVAAVSSLWSRFSAEPDIPGYYTPERLALIAAYLLMLLVWAWVTVRLMLCVSDRHLEGLVRAIERLTTRPLLFWGAVIGSWGAMIAFLLLSATRPVNTLEIAGVLVTFICANLLILTLGLCTERGHSKWWRRATTIGLTTLLLAEIAQAPLQLHSAQASPLLWGELPAEEGNFAVIDLPMSRQASKMYMYYQTLHGRPIAEGMIARMPPDAYDFIEANLLLAAWHSKEPLDCGAYDVTQAARDLLDVDFRYVIIHHMLWVGRGKPVIGWADGYFANIEPRYQDDFITVYALQDLADVASPCD